MKSVVSTRIFNCNNCDEKMKDQFGCYEAKKDPVWVHEECPYCTGSLQHCYLCKGENEIPFYRCAHKSVTKDNRILPYYAEYLKFGVYPDRRGRLYQR